MSPIASIERHSVETELTKILASPEFSRSQQISRFLQFLVGHVLEQRPEPLRERFIGEKVFDRPAEYDPKIDPIVRTEARRLRKKLQSYYETDGRTDGLRIVIPKGSYLPQFEPFHPPLQDDALQNAALQDAALQDAALQDAALPIAKPRHGITLRPRDIALGAAVAVAFCVISFAGLNRLRRTASPAFEVLPFANEFGSETSPAISPDGRTIAYSWDGNANNTDIYLKSVEKKTVSRFTADPAEDLYPAWSPDGRNLAWVRSSAQGAHVVVKPLEGGSEREVVRIEIQSSAWITDSGVVAANPGPAWTPDGKQLVVSDPAGFDRGIFRADLTGGAMARLTSPKGMCDDLFPRVSPDGRSIGFVRYCSHGSGAVYTVPSSGGEPSRLTAVEPFIRGLAWVPDGQALLFASRRGSSQLWLVGSHGGDPVMVPTNSSAAAEPAVATTGDWLAYVETSENWNIWRAALTGTGLGEPHRLISSSGRNHSPQYSPDGSRLAFVSDRSGHWEVWVADSNGSNAQQVTQFEGPWLGGLNWSPDGRRLALDGRPHGHAAVFVVDVASHGTPKVLEENRFEERMPAWSRDGKFISFSSNRGGPVALWKRPVEGGPAIPVTTQPAFRLVESASGKEMFYDGFGQGIWRARVDWSGAAPVPGLETVYADHNWAPSATGIYFVNREASTPQSLWFYRFNGGGVSEALAGLRPFVLNTPSLTISPDNRWLVFAQVEQTSSDIRIRRGALPSTSR